MLDFRQAAAASILVAVAVIQLLFLFLLLLLIFLLASCYFYEYINISAKCTSVRVRATNWLWDNDIRILWTVSHLVSHLMAMCMCDKSDGSSDKMYNLSKCCIHDKHEFCVDVAQTILHSNLWYRNWTALSSTGYSPLIQ